MAVPKSASSYKRGFWSCFRPQTQAVEDGKGVRPTGEVDEAGKPHSVSVAAKLQTAGSGWRAIFTQLLEQEEAEALPIITAGGSNATLPRATQKRDSHTTLGSQPQKQEALEVREVAVQDRLFKTLPAVHRDSEGERRTVQPLGQLILPVDSKSQHQHSNSKDSGPSSEEPKEEQPSTHKVQPEQLQARKSFAMFRQGSALSKRTSLELEEPDRNSVPLSAAKELEVLESISKIRLRGVDNEIIRAESLWQERPAMLLLLRRPGCGAYSKLALTLLMTNTFLATVYCCIVSGESSECVSILPQLTS